MNLRKIMKMYQDKGLSSDFASARVCQDIVLKAIADGPFNRNITIKGGIVMRNISDDNRRSTRDIDLDFIHYSLSDESIRIFVNKLNCIPGIKISIVGEVKELKHQDYHGKRVLVKIADEEKTEIISKIDIGVHKHFEIEQDEYCFDVFMDEDGASLLKNTAEQIFAEKLRSLLIFGTNSHRYKDIYDLYYLKNIVDKDKLDIAMHLFIFDDIYIRECSYIDIIKRICDVFNDGEFLIRISKSRQRWVDGDIEEIVTEITDFLRKLEVR